MFLRILKLDLKKRKLTNILLLLFIILATIFSASGINNVASVINGTDYYFDKAEVGDYVIIADYNTNAKEILDKDKTVIDYKVESSILAMKSNLKYKGETLDTGTNIIFQSIDDTKTNIFNKDDKEITEVKKGEIFLSGRALEKSNVSVGDEVTVEFENTKFKLKVAGKTKDALFGSDFMGITRILMNEEDYKKVYSATYKEENKGDKGAKIYYVKLNDSMELEQSLGDATSILFKGSRDILKICYVMDMIISFVVLALSICLIVVALLILKFIMTFTINEEYREIGVMKAIGIKNKSIRGIYIIKYLSLGLIGATIGFLLSIPVGDILIKSTTDNMVLGNSNSILINIIGALLIVFVILLFAYIYTGKVKKASPVDAIRNGQTGERYNSKTIYKLKNSHLRLNSYMAINDMLGSPKRFITIIVSLFVCLTLVLGIVITTDTMKSKNLVLTFATESDVYFIPGNISYIGNMSETTKEGFEKSLKNYENLFRENEMPCIARVELQFSKNVIFKGNKYNVRTLQGLNTKESEYVYTEGIAPKYDNEVAITDIISKKIGAKIGDKVIIEDSIGKKEYIVTAYFQSLNNLGEVIRIPNKTESSFKDLAGTGWLQIDFTDNPNKEEIDKRIEKIKKLVDSEDVYDAAGMVADNIGVVPTMEAVQYLLLGITIVVIILVVLLMELSFVTSEKSQIALLKALGFKNSQIIRWHMYRFIFVTVITEILAILLAGPITKLWCDQVFGMMGAHDITYFINPVHIYLLYPGIVLISTIIISYLAAQATNRIKSSDTASIE